VYIFGVEGRKGKGFLHWMVTNSTEYHGKANGPSFDHKACSLFLGHSKNMFGQHPTAVDSRYRPHFLKHGVGKLQQNLGLQADKIKFSTLN